MSPSTFKVHMVAKSDYTNQKVVSLPADFTLPPLEKGFIRVRSRIVSLSINNFSYARFGELLGWYSTWPDVPSLPEPYNDPSKYGRIAAWGYGEVIESAHDDVAIGTKIYGYLPIGTLPEDLQVTSKTPGQLEEVCERRTTKVLPFYNHYATHPSTLDLSANKEALGLEALLRPMLETGVLMNRYGFAWAGGRKPLHPAATGEWSLEQSDITDAVVVLLGASGKTGLLLANELRFGRAKEHAPRKVIAVGSDKSRALNQGTGFFDEVVLYEDAAKEDLGSILGVDKETKVVLVNLAGRGDAADRWAVRLRQLGGSLAGFAVGGDPTAAPGDFVKSAQQEGSGVYRVSAPGMHMEAREVEGDAQYFELVDQAWAAFAERGALSSVRLDWHEGIESFEDGWNNLVKGQLSPNIGLVYEL